MKAAEFLSMFSKSKGNTFHMRPQGVSGRFSSLCDGNCGDGVCGQCDCE
jgi:hypothetical protein